MNLQDVDSLLSTQELFLITAAPRDTIHLIRVFNLYMQSHPGVFGLNAIAVVALLFGADEFMHGSQPPLPVLDTLSLTKPKILFFQGDPTTMKAHATQSLENYIKEPIVINWTCQLNVTKVSRIRLVVDVAKTRVVDTTVDGLSCHIGLCEDTR